MDIKKLVADYVSSGSEERSPQKDEGNIDVRSTQEFGMGRSSSKGSRSYRIPYDLDTTLPGKEVGDKGNIDFRSTQEFGVGKSSSKGSRSYRIPYDLDTALPGKEVGDMRCDVSTYQETGLEKTRVKARRSYRITSDSESDMDLPLTLTRKESEVGPLSEYWDSDTFQRKRKGHGQQRFSVPADGSLAGGKNGKGVRLQRSRVVDGKVQSTVAQKNSCTTTTTPSRNEMVMSRGMCKHHHRGACCCEIYSGMDSSGAAPPLRKRAHCIAFPTLPSQERKPKGQQ